MVNDTEIKLFPFQVEGTQWLSGKKFALLADEMGLGKSAQAIRAADAIQAERILVLCPAVARMNWSREFARFSKRALNCTVILAAAQSARLPSSGVTICSYDLASNKSVLRALSANRWSLCVLDEAHYLKNRMSKRTRAALGQLAPRADRVWALTGTPAPNNPSELWPLLRTFGTTKLDYWAFMRRYCVFRDTPFGVQITGGRNIPELKALIAPFMLRRKKDQVMTQLPKISFHDVVVESTPIPERDLSMYFDNYLSYPPDRRWQQFHKDVAEQHRLLGTLADDVGIKSADGVQILEALAVRVRSLRRYIGLQKVPKVLELIKSELDSGAYEKIVLFGVHKNVLTELRNGLSEYGAVLIYGGTPADKRDRMIKAFQNDPKTRVFVGQTVAAGTAITLTAAHQVGVVEADWTPANNQQAVMRVHRIGQTRPVTVRFFSIAGSIDEKIQKVLRQKTKTLTALFDEPEKIDPFAD